MTILTKKIKVGNIDSYVKICVRVSDLKNVRRIEFFCFGYIFTSEIIDQVDFESLKKKFNFLLNKNSIKNLISIKKFILKDNGRVIDLQFTFTIRNNVKEIETNLLIWKKFILNYIKLVYGYKTNYKKLSILYKMNFKEENIGSERSEVDSV